jgi:iron complex transport system ATP-binding protein
VTVAAERVTEVRARGVSPLWAAGAAAFLLCSLAIGVLAGPVDLGAGAVLESVAARLHLPGFSSSLSPTEEAILWEIRMPRVILAALVGAMLSLAGATYQGVFRNPLADPYLLGVAAGAGLGATIAIAYLPDGLLGQKALPAAAFVGGIVAVLLTYAVGRSARRERDAATLVLAGVTVAAFFTAWQTFVQQQNSETLQQVYSWILGNIPSSGWADVVLILPYVVVAAVVILSRPAHARRRGDARDSGGRRRQRAHRLRRDHRPARDQARRRRRLSHTAAAVGRRRGGLPRPRGRHRADCALARGDPARRGDRVLRGPLLRARAADDPRRSGMTAIELRGVSVSLGGRFVVSEVDASIAAGEWLALIGPNGAGKTTLLRAVAGLLSHTGTIFLDGRPASELRRAELARLLAVVPQEPFTPPWMTVAEYVLLGRTPHIGALAREGGLDREVAAGALARLHLLPYRDRPLGTLSGGEKQRVVVARALAQEARIVLLDEPTASLDIGHQQQALELLDLLRHESGLTLVTAMHDLTLAAQYADRMILLDEGRVAADGAPADVLTEALVAGHYGAEIDVVSVGDRIAVVPRRADRPRSRR